MKIAQIAKDLTITTDEANELLKSSPWSGAAEIQEEQLTILRQAHEMKSELGSYDEAFKKLDKLSAMTPEDLSDEMLLETFQQRVQGQLSQVGQVFDADDAQFYRGLLDAYRLIRMKELQHLLRNTNVVHELITETRQPGKSLLEKARSLHPLGVTNPKSLPGTSESN